MQGQRAERWRRQRQQRQGCGSGSAAQAAQVAAELEAVIAIVQRRQRKWGRYFISLAQSFLDDFIKDFTAMKWKPLRFDSVLTFAVSCGGRVLAGFRDEAVLLRP